MALKPCKKCKQEVEDNAKFCQHCGVKDPGVGAKEMIAGSLGLALIVSLIVYSCSGEEEKENPVAENVAASVETVEHQTPSTPVLESPASVPQDEVKEDAPQPSHHNLGMTPDEFRKAYNVMIGQIEESWRVAEFDIQEGSVNNVFNVKLGNTSHIVGRVDKVNDQLLDVTVLVGGGGTPDDNIHAVAVMLSVAQVTTQGASKEKISNAVNNMMTKALESLENPKAKPKPLKIGNREYNISASHLTGIIFSISDASKTKK